MNAIERMMFEDILKDFNRLERHEISLKHFYHLHPKGYLNWLRAIYQQDSELSNTRSALLGPEAKITIGRYLYMLDYVINNLPSTKTHSGQTQSKRQDLQNQ